VIAAQRPGGTPLQGQPGGQQQQLGSHGYSNPYANANSPPATAYNILQPINSGNLDLSNIKPVHSGSVSLADAVARARGIAAEKGVPFDGGRGGGSESTPLDSR
jgi:far upstream element-binding protein